MKKILALVVLIMVWCTAMAQNSNKGVAQPQEDKLEAVSYTVVCPVVKDTWIYAFRPDSNYGQGRGWKDRTDPEKDLTVPKMFLGFGGTDIKIILAQFDLTKLPKGKKPLKASVKFYNDYAGSAAETKVDLKMIAMPWEELKVTWKKKPKWTSVSISSLILKGGIDYNQAGRWYEWDVAKLIDIWMVKNKPNFGIALVPQGDSGVDRDFICKEYKGKEQFFPVLEVTYKKDQPETKALPQSNK
jgi:hypothetical protein